ncbi:hypothetical protein RIR_jg7827.t1 [Rhizophagus irregularis DAOM 181602=DAOM 197198]|nr:hypothetical protein RIR_jg7827.t1 [Rhizophagus irregularis DAOM 181602=DAOM 197198]
MLNINCLLFILNINIYHLAVSVTIRLSIPYKKRKFGICPEKYGKCPETFRASGKHSETVMFWNIFRTLDSGQILDKFWSVKKMSGICASGKCSKT